MNMIRKLVISIALILPLLFIFKSIFLPGHLAWGDAPHFYPEELKELIGEPLAWDHRGQSFGGVSSFVFIWPLMFIYGLIGNNDLAIRNLFYIPSITFSVVGTYFLAKYLKLSKRTQFISVLVYLFNTYFLLLIDGGQVGVALAYGLFPLVLLFLKKLFDNPSTSSFFLGLVSLVLIGIADPRVAAVEIITIFLWQILEGNFISLIYFPPLIICWLGVNMYWLLPLIKNSMEALSFSSSELEIIKWYNPLFLFSPHWYENLFGKVTRPPIYFTLVSLLIFGGLFVKKEKETITFVILFLIFAILSLGLIPFSKVPFGFAFRDSTKFFIPLLVFAGILIGNTLDRFKNNLLSYVSYFYILLLVYPALLGKMNFVLSGRPPSVDYQKIYENLKKDDGFYISAWFPERHLMSYEIENSPSIDARDLAHFWPFASMDASEDVFNFLNNEDFPKWFRVLGIKYLILSDNPREISKNEDDKKSWNTILNLVDKNKSLKRVDWGVGVPIYKVESTYPRFYTVDKLIAVIGSSLPPSQSFVPAIYFEDGKWDPKSLKGKNPSSIKILFNGKDKTDLALSFLQKYFVSSEEALKREWAVYSNDQYLKYKYELLIRGVKFIDFDYGKGLAFSTEKGEKMEFKFSVPESGEYIFVYRSMVPSNGQRDLGWKTIPLSLTKGNYVRVIENNSDLQILNVVALIPKKEFDQATKLADTYISSFGEAKKEELKFEEVNNLEISKLGALKYKFENLGKNFWVVYNEGFYSLWKLRRGKDYFESVPVFSMVNGFYVQNDWRDLSIEFVGQESLRWGIYWSAVSILVLLIIHLLLLRKSEKEV